MLSIVTGLIFSLISHSSSSAGGFKVPPSRVQPQAITDELVETINPNVANKLNNFFIPFFLSIFGFFQFLLLIYRPYLQYL